MEVEIEIEAELGKKYAKPKTFVIILAGDHLCFVYGLSSKMVISSNSSTHSTKTNMSFRRVDKVQVKLFKIEKI